MASKEAFEGSEAQEYAERTFSAMLPSPPENLSSREGRRQAAPDFNPDRDEFDLDHPAARPIDPNLDYGSCLASDGVRVFKAEVVKQLFRMKLLASQMHKCCATCFKYMHDNLCRFHFPHNVCLEADEEDFTGKPRMVTYMGARGRQRVVVEAPRNNENLNRHAAAPAVTLCAGGNTDATCATPKPATTML